MSAPQSGVDPAALAQVVDDLREVMRASVAGLVSDGFTDREAHAIIAGLLGNQVNRDGEQ